MFCPAVTSVLAGALGADSGQLERARSFGVHEPLGLTVELEDLAVRLSDAAGKAAQREPCGPCGLVDRFAVGARADGRARELLGERNWYLPGWLQWLPHFEPEEPSTAPEATPVPVSA